MLRRTLQQRPTQALASSSLPFFIPAIWFAEICDVRGISGIPLYFALRLVLVQAATLASCRLLNLNEDDCSWMISLTVVSCHHGFMKHRHPHSTRAGPNYHPVQIFVWTGNICIRSNCTSMLLCFCRIIPLPDIITLSATNDAELRVSDTKGQRH